MILVFCLFLFVFTYVCFLSLFTIYSSPIYQNWGIQDVITPTQTHDLHDLLKYISTDTSYYLEVLHLLNYTDESMPSAFYDYYNKRLVEPSLLLKPRILHLIWIGDEPEPNGMKTWTVDFAAAHPDWEVKVWKNEHVEAFQMVNQNAFDNMPQLCGKADIWRFEIIYRYGGLYIDADTTWLHKKVDLLDTPGLINFVKESDELITTGFIYSVAKHPYIKRVVESIPESICNNPNSMSWVTTGPALLYRVYKNLPKVVSNDIYITEFDSVLCPGTKEGTWFNITKENVQSKSLLCQKSQAFAFHYGFSTNNQLSI